MRTIAAAAVLAAFLVAAPIAAASSVSVSVNPDPVVEDVPFTMTASGTADNPDGEHLGVYVRPAGGAPCAPTDDTETGDELIDDWVDGAFTRSFNGTMSVNNQRPGSYLVCSYMHTSDGTSTFQGSTTFSVRAAHATLALAAPDVVDPGANFQVTASYGSEASRSLAVYSVEPGSGQCPANLDLLGDNYLSEIVDDYAQGTGTRSGVTSISQRGSYLLCGYISGGADGPDAVAQRPITIGTPPPPPALSKNHPGCAPPRGPGDHRVHSYGLHVKRTSCAVGRTVVLRSTRHLAWWKGRPFRVAGHVWRCHSTTHRPLHERCSSAFRLVTITWP